MKVLYCSSECVPFVKTGGLADVAGSLPKNLRNQGIDIRVVLPKYSMVKTPTPIALVANMPVLIGKETVSTNVYSLSLDSVTYYFIENDSYFNRETLYGYQDDGERFGFFNRAILEMLKVIDFIPDIIHVNDWHTAIIPLIYRLDYRELYPKLKTILTIHNLQYQGSFDTAVLDKCNISQEEFYNGTVRFNEKVNFLKTGIVTSDLITTVSETYAREILEPTYSEGLDSVLALRRKEIVGILNGIDYEIYNSLTDNFIPYKYDKEDLKNKYLNKSALQEELSLPGKNIPVIGMVTRLVSQKGFDLVCEVFSHLMALDIQLVILGRGSDKFELFFKSMETIYKDKFRIHTAFNERLGQLIYAGSDFLLMPSLFEPCGLSQMIAMRYGTIPIVRETGGLKDTVIPFNEYTLKGNGFGFKSFSAYDMLGIIKYALDIYKQKDKLQIIINEAMTIDFSWKKQTLKYYELYNSILI